MITNNIFQRTFQIAFGENVGTAFTLDIEGKQYLVTAKHVVQGFNGGVLEIFRDNNWMKLNFELVGHCVGDADISVLTADVLLSQTHPLPATAAHLTLGQSVYFLGFPLDLMGIFPEHINNKFPVALAKAGILSSMTDQSNGSFLLIDGFSNKGMSGGPLVFVPNGQTASLSNPYRVAGVISCFKAQEIPVFDQDGMETGHYIHENSGITVAYEIRNAVDMIQENPIGFRVS